MIERIQPAGTGLAAPQAGRRAGAVDLGRRFSDTLNDAIAKIEADERHLDELNKRALDGDFSSIEQMLIAGEKASLNLQLTVKIRNKIIAASQEIMRMQI